MAGYSLQPHALTALSHAATDRKHEHNRTREKITARYSGVKMEIGIFLFGIFTSVSGYITRENRHLPGARSVNAAFYGFWKSGIMTGCEHTDVSGTPNVFPVPSNSNGTGPLR
jgi:hypothetical protein